MKKNENIKNLLYYFKGIDLKTLFYAVALLDENDIAIILKKFGNSLQECNPVSPLEESRINYLVHDYLPKLIKEYQKFTTSLFVFFKVPSKTFLRKILFNLDEEEQKLIFTAFDSGTFAYKKDHHLSVTTIKQIFKLLKRVDINSLNQQYKEYAQNVNINDELLLTAMLTGVERRIFRKNDKNTTSYIRLINEVLPRKKKELLALKTNLCCFFERYTKAEIKEVLLSLQALRNFPLYDYYDPETLDYIYPQELSYIELLNLYGFLVFTLKETLKSKYRGRLKEFNPKTQSYNYVINPTALKSYHDMSNEIGTSLAGKIANNLIASKGSIKLLRELSVYTEEESKIMKEKKQSIKAFIDEYLISLSSLKEQSLQKSFFSDF